MIRKDVVKSFSKQDAIKGVFGRYGADEVYFIDELDVYKNRGAYFYVKAEDAKSIVDEYNQNNRLIRPLTVKKYRFAMESGGWDCPTRSNPIVFSDKPRLIDGQHRLIAQYESGMDIIWFISTGERDESASYIDQGAIRTTKEQMQYAGEVYGNKAFSALQKVYYWHWQGIRACTSRIPTAIMINILDDDIVAEKMSLIDIICSEYCRDGSAFRSEVTSAIFAASYYEDDEKLKQFARIYNDRYDEDEIPKIQNGYKMLELISKLKNTIRTSSGVNYKLLENHKKAQRVIKAFCNNEVLSNILTPNDMIYRARPPASMTDYFGYDS
ncbi:MAG: hypothetical protein PHE87_08400 [Victivallaceae bacterium]|nr:hypothetical protein [Victivallaceae bacterium]